jgi:hypothetical protein
MLAVVSSRSASPGAARSRRPRQRRPGNGRPFAAGFGRSSGAPARPARAAGGFRSGGMPQRFGCLPNISVVDGKIYPHHDQPAGGRTYPRRRSPGTQRRAAQLQPGDTVVVWGATGKGGDVQASPSRRPPRVSSTAEASRGLGGGGHPAEPDKDTRRLARAPTCSATKKRDEVKLIRRDHSNTKAVGTIWAASSALCAVVHHLTGCPRAAARPRDHPRDDHQRNDSGSGFAVYRTVSGLRCQLAGGDKRARRTPRRTPSFTPPSSRHSSPAQASARRLRRRIQTTDGRTQQPGVREVQTCLTHGLTPMPMPATPPPRRRWRRAASSRTRARAAGPSAAPPAGERSRNGTAFADFGCLKAWCQHGGTPVATKMQAALAAASCCRPAAPDSTTTTTG